MENAPLMSMVDRVGDLSDNPRRRPRVSRELAQLLIQPLALD
jgi:hypothetical protein